MFEAIQDFFNSDEFMPHGHCFLWEPQILWLHLISDALIVAAYYSIPFALIYFVKKRKDLPFKGVFWLFGAFIFLCGTTHLMNIWVIWHPDYALDGIIKALTAIVSVATFFFTVNLIPSALKILSPVQIKKQNEELKLKMTKEDNAHQALKIAFKSMEDKVNEQKIVIEALNLLLDKENKKQKDVDVK